MKQTSANHLGEYIKDTREQKRLALRDIEERSHGLISGGHLSRIENGFVANLTVQSIVVLAHALEVPKEELFRLACGLPAKAEADGQKDHLIALYNSLPDRGRKLTVALAEQVWLAERQASAIFPIVRLPEPEEIERSKQARNRTKTKENVVEVPNGRTSQKAKGHAKLKRHKTGA